MARPLAKQSAMVQETLAQLSVHWAPRRVPNENRFGAAKPSATVSACASCLVFPSIEGVLSRRRPSFLPSFLLSFSFRSFVTDSSKSKKKGRGLLCANI